MEAARSSRSSSTEMDEPKMRDVESVVDITASSEMQSSANGENSSTCPEEKHSELQKEDSMGTALKRKIYEGGLGDVRVPEMALHMSGCGASEETESDDDDDLCSSSDEESSYNPLTSGVTPPVLPDIQIRVPMENENDVRRVKEALLLKGVLDVVCDQERQIVTVTGVVPPSRLLKKVRKVNRQARIVSTVSPFAAFMNPHFRSSALTFQEESDSPAIDIPAPHPVPNFVVYQQQPRPAFQRYNFHNDPHSPYLRTFSPTDLSPINSSPLATGDAFDHHRRINGCSFLDDESFLLENGVMST